VLKQSLFNKSLKSRGGGKTHCPPYFEKYMWKGSSKRTCPPVHRMIDAYGCRRFRRRFKHSFPFGRHPMLRLYSPIEYCPHDTHTHTHTYISAGPSSDPLPARSQPLFLASTPQSPIYTVVQSANISFKKNSAALLYTFSAPKIANTAVQRQKERERETVYSP